MILNVCKSFICNLSCQKLLHFYFSKVSSFPTAKFRLYERMAEWQVDGVYFVYIHNNKSLRRKALLNKKKSQENMLQMFSDSISFEEQWGVDVVQRLLPPAMWCWVTLLLIIVHSFTNNSGQSTLSHTHIH